MAKKYLQTGTTPSPDAGGATELATNSSPVNVSSTSAPNPGDVLTATSGTDADWAAPSSGGVQDDPTVRTSGFTAVANTRYFVNSNFVFTAFMPAGPSDGDVVAFAGVFNQTGTLTVNGNGTNIRPAPASVGTGSSFAYRMQNLDVAFRYYSTTNLWECVSASVSSLTAGLPSYTVPTISFGQVSRISLTGGYSVPGRLEFSEIQELFPWQQAHNLYASSTSPGTHQDTATGVQSPWLFNTQALRSHAIRWAGASDVIVRGLYPGSGPSDVELRHDKLIINDTGSLGTGTFRNIIWKKNDTSQSATYRVNFESAAPSTDFADYVQPPGTCVLIRWQPYISQWVLTPMVPSGRIDRGVTTTNATATTIHTHQTQLNDRLIMYKAQVWALLTAGTTVGDSALFDVAAMFRRDGAGVITLKDVTFVNGPFKDAGAAAWDVTFLISGTTIAMQVTGDSGDTIRWRVVGNITEHG